LLVPTTHRWAGRTSIRGEDLQTENYIWQEKGSPTRRLIEEKMSALFDLALMPHSLELSRSRAVVTAVEAGLGVGIVSRYAAQDAIALGRVRAIGLEDLDLSRKIWQIKHRQNKSSYVMSAFEAFINDKDICKKHNIN
jgi:DNA-binding transcriptional LysR family regulator